jgi:hypothetical protein
MQSINPFFALALYTSSKIMFQNTNGCSFLLVQKRNQKKTGSDKYSVKLTETPTSDKTTCPTAQNPRSAAKTVLSFSLRGFLVLHKYFSKALMLSPLQNVSR